MLPPMLRVLLRAPVVPGAVAGSRGGHPGAGGGETAPGDPRRLQGGTRKGDAEG